MALTCGINGSRNRDIVAYSTVLYDEFLYTIVKNIIYGFSIYYNRLYS